MDLYIFKLLGALNLALVASRIRPGCKDQGASEQDVAAPRDNEVLHELTCLVRIELHDASVDSAYVPYFRRCFTVIIMILEVNATPVGSHHLINESTHRPCDLMRTTASVQCCTTGS